MMTNRYPVRKSRLRSDRRSGPLCPVVILLALALFTLPLGQAAAGRNPAVADPAKLLGNGAYGVTGNGRLLTAANLDAPLIPASIAKILTALAAFAELGEDYRFKTEFFLDSGNHLYIKGYGDPFLVSEEIEKIMVALKKAGIETINEIRVDESSYRLEAGGDVVGTSLNPYDSAISALAVNFNTINITVAADGTVRSAEPQTPLLPLMTRLGKKLPPGEHRINISGSQGEPLLLAGQLFRSFQRKAGIGGEGRIARGVAPPGPPTLTYYSSRTLSELVAGLLLYSNNFIANQIFLQAGAKMFGYPVTWEKGRRAMRVFLRKDPLLGSGAIKLIEGSGLSRKNRLTVRAMLRILDLFKPWAALLPDKKGILVKSGTMSGVYSYAGYFRNNGGLDGFAIILNQAENRREELLEILRGIHGQAVKAKPGR
jgi:D-alanyl-D-alanine carboxypeptidase/D-alanyl-D-alanine-endopeptidase (penicillin-binding protein 4)